MIPGAVLASSERRVAEHDQHRYVRLGWPVALAVQVDWRGPRFRLTDDLASAGQMIRYATGVNPP